MGVTTGGSSSTTTVATSTAVPFNSANAYVAIVATKPDRPVTGVSGMGGTWSLVDNQCGARSQTGVNVWITTNATTSGVVTATLSGSATNASIAVAEYSGVDLNNPTGTVTSANTNGVDGGCSGGSDNNNYSLSIPNIDTGSLVIGAIADRNRSHNPGTGWTEQLEFTQGSGGGAAGLALVDQLFTGPATGTLDGTFNSNVDWSVAGIELRGGGTPPTPQPEIDVSPTSLSFGSVNVGATPTLDVTIENLGNADLNVTDSVITSGGPEFTVTVGGGAVAIPPGQTHDVTVQFAPTLEQPYTGNLQILSDDPDEGSVDIPLDGTGVAAAPDIDVSPTSLSFGSVNVGSTPTLDVTIENLGNATLNVTDSVISLGGPEFSVTVGGGAVAIPPGKHPHRHGPVRTHTRTALHRQPSPSAATTPTRARWRSNSTAPAPPLRSVRRRCCWVIWVLVSRLVMVRPGPAISCGRRSRCSPGSRLPRIRTTLII